MITWSLFSPENKLWLFYSAIQLIPGDLNKHSLLDKVNDGCTQQEDRMETRGKTSLSGE